MVDLVRAASVLKLRCCRTNCCRAPADFVVIPRPGARRGRPPTSAVRSLRTCRWLCDGARRYLAGDHDRCIRCALRSPCGMSRSMGNGASAHIRALDRAVPIHEPGIVPFPVLAVSEAGSADQSARDRGPRRRRRSSLRCGAGPLSSHARLLYTPFRLARAAPRSHAPMPRIARRDRRRPFRRPVGV